MPKGKYTAADLDAPTQSGQQGQFTAADIDSTPPSAASRFRGSFARGMGVVSPEEGKNFFAHPIDTLKRMGETQADLGRRAGSEFKGGDYLGAATHGIEYLMPGLGPTLAHAGDQLESGDTAGGVGTTLGAGSLVALGSPEARGVVKGSLAKAMTSRLGRTAGKAVTGVAEDIPIVRQLTKLRGYWRDTAPPPPTEAEPVFPGADQPQTPSEAFFQGKGLREGGKPGVDPAAGLAKIPRGSTAASFIAARDTAPPPIAETPAAQQSAAPPPAPQATPRAIPKGQWRKAMDEQLSKGLGARQLDPNVPLRNQVPGRMPAESDAALPEGHKAVDSSAMRSYQYDAPAREFHARATSGNTIYVYGDVTPETAAAFEAAESKGKAWQQIQRNHPLVAKIVNGKRTAVVPSGR